MIQTECTICHQPGNNLHRIIYSFHNGFEVIQCNHCLNVYTFFKDDINMQLYYDEKDYTVRDTKSSIFYTIQKIEYTNIINKLKATITKTNPSLLDFGSGKGLFLFFAKQKGFGVKGVETSIPRANYAKENFHLNINTDYYSEGKIFEDLFDIITCFHVAEHLTHPTQLLKNLIAGNLKKDGLFLLEVPNYSSWQSKWSGKQWLHLDIPRHLTHFTPVLARNIMEQNNCKVFKESYFSFHLGVLGMVQTIYCFFGYKNSIIATLKERKNILPLILIAITLPFACILEYIAAINKKGGVIRYYAIKTQ